MCDLVSCISSLKRMNESFIEVVFNINTIILKYSATYCYVSTLCLQKAVNGD